MSCYHGYRVVQNNESGLHLGLTNAQLVHGVLWASPACWILRKSPERCTGRCVRVLSPLPLDIQNQAHKHPDEPPRANDGLGHTNHLHDGFLSNWWELWLYLERGGRTVSMNNRAAKTVLTTDLSICSMRHPRAQLIHVLFCAQGPNGCLMSLLEYIYELDIPVTPFV